MVDELKPIALACSRLLRLEGGVDHDARRFAFRVEQSLPRAWDPDHPSFTRAYTDSSL